MHPERLDDILDVFSDASNLRDMTRRAFLSSRVIQAQGKSDSNRRVKKWEKMITKMEIF